MANTSQDYFNRALDIFRSEDRMQYAPFLLGTQAQIAGQNLVNQNRQNAINAEQNRQNEYADSANNAYSNLLNVFSNPGGSIANANAYRSNFINQGLDANAPTMPGSDSSIFSDYLQKSNDDAMNSASDYAMNQSSLASVNDAMNNNVRNADQYSDEISRYADYSNRSLSTLEPELNVANQSGEQLYGLGEMLRQFSGIAAINNLQEQQKQAAKQSNEKFKSEWTRYLKELNSMF